MLVLCRAVQQNVDATLSQGGIPAVAADSLAAAASAEAVPLSPCSAAAQHT